MIRLETVILIQLLMGIPLVILLLKTIELKRQIAQIIKEVTKYLDFITQEEECQEQERVHKESKKMRSERAKEEDQNRLIQTVLREYFP
jgi:hypothetical protein